MIINYVHGVKYAVVVTDVSLEWKSQIGFQYEDDVCMMASSEEDMKVSIEKVNECVIGYGFNVNENKSKGFQTTQHTSGGAVTTVTNYCANCVETSLPQLWGPITVFWRGGGQVDHADLLDGWHCS